MSINITAEQHYLYRSLAFTLAAIALYIPANLYPFMMMKYAGRYQYTTIWDGIRSLFESGQWGIATIVLTASLIIPIFKLLAMLFIITAKLYNFAPDASTSLLALVDFIGRWSMLDIFLVAIMVALIKFGNFATVNAETGAWLFGCCVIFTMLASASLSECYEEKPACVI